MTPISVAMIVKNEEAVIRRCLAALAWVDEIVVLDTGSSDNTPQICEEMGARVFPQEKWEGFGKARQQACALATNDWILSIDADEVVTPELQREIQALREEGFQKVSYRLKVRSYYLGRAIKYCGWQNETHIRLYNRLWVKGSDALVHESLYSSVPQLVLKGYIEHHTYPTRAKHMAKMKLYGELGAAKLRAKGKRPLSGEASFRAAFTFVKMYVLNLGFLDGWHGFELCKTTAWGTWYKYKVLKSLCAS